MSSSSHIFAALRALRQSFALLLAFAILMAPFPNTAIAVSGESIVSPDRALPETIEDLIAALENRKLSQGKELNQPQTSKDKEPETVPPKFFDSNYLEQHREYFTTEAAFLGDADEVKRFAFKLFEQWIYLELFRLKRQEYLMINYAKLLLLDSLSPEISQAKFAERFVVGEFSHSPYLVERYQELYGELSADKASEKEMAQDFTKGFVESIYLSMAALNHKRTLLAERYDSSDERFEQGMETIAEKEELVRHASALTETEAFQDLVKPYIDTEALPTQLSIEAATNRYLKELYAFLEKEKTITDLYDYVTSQGMPKLNEDFAISLESSRAKSFRSRINTAFPAAIQELRENIETVIDEHKAEVLPFATANYVALSNSSSIDSYRNYSQWLELVFKEQVIHWIITEEYPFLQSAAEGLSNFVAEELRQQKLDRLIEMSAATMLFSISPLGKIGKRASGWMGTRLLQFWRYVNLGLKAGLVSYFSYGTYQRYLEWQRMRRLSITNIEGTGLASLIQAEGAFRNLAMYGALTGGTFALSLTTTRGFFREIAKNQKQTNRILKAFNRTWNNNPIALAAINRNTARHLSLFRNSLQNLKIKAAGGHLLTIGSNIGAIFTQFFTMVPAHMPNWIKSFLHSIPKQVYSGVTLGTVMGIMGVTVQSYITAGGLQAFVWGFQKIGFTPPEYWQLNALNQAERLKRDAFLSIERDLIFAKQEIAKALGMMTMWERMLASEELSTEERANLNAAIEGSEETVRSQLQITLLRWYKYVEVRSLQNSVLEEKGFGILASPNEDDPVRITIFVNVGGKVLAHAMTVKEIEHIINRNGVPNLGMDKSELQSLAERLGL